MTQKMPCTVGSGGGVPTTVVHTDVQSVSGTGTMTFTFSEDYSNNLKVLGGKTASYGVIVYKDNDVWKAKWDDGSLTNATVSDNGTSFVINGLSSNTTSLCLVVYGA